MILGQINKNKSLLRIITISIFVFIFLTPFIVFADATTTGILPPCVSSPTGCVFNDFLTLAQNIIDFVLKISVTVAVIMFTWAGILYLTASGDKGNIEKAHKIFGMARKTRAPFVYDFSKDKKYIFKIITELGVMNYSEFVREVII